MTHDPQPITDVFGFLMGDGFVMASRPTSIDRARARVLSEALDELGRLDGELLGIEDDVAELEALLR